MTLRPRELIFSGSCCFRLFFVQLPDQSPGSFRISVILSNNCRITLRPPMAIESYFLNSDPDDPNQKICRLGNDFQLFSTSLAPGTEAIAHRPAIMFDNWQDSKYKTPHCMRVGQDQTQKTAY